MMITELPKLEDLSKDELLEEAVASPYPIHPFYILEAGSAACFFEPLMSVQKMAVIGLEGVQRAVDPDDSRHLVEPQDLFRNLAPGDSHLRMPLDRLFLQKSLEGFLPLQAQAPHLLMFIDVEPSALEESMEDPDNWLQQAREWSLDPRRIVLQISLSGRVDPMLVRRFLESQRDRGFLTALRDVNNSPQHLDVLLRFNTDLVKVEDRLVRGMAQDNEKQAAFLTVLKRAHTLGILVMAGGIESEEDALVALEFGVDLVQGRYFSKSYRKNRVFTLKPKARLQFLASRFKRRVTGKANRDRDLKNRCSAIASSLAACLPQKPAGEWEGELSTLFRHFPPLECLYLLNAQGVLVGETLCNQWHIPERKGLLFHPTSAGTDHSLQEFYYTLLSDPAQRRYVSEPYLSMNSGHLCITVALLAGDPSGDFHILCADLNAAKV